MVSPVFGFGLFFSILLVVKTIDLPPLQHVVCSNDKGNYTAGSDYERNLNDFFSSLLSNKSDNGYRFFRASFGQNVDKVYGIGLCRPDLNPDACLSYLRNSTSLLKQACPNQKEAIIWTDHSMLRYSNRSLDGKLELVPAYNQSVTGNLSSSDVESFNGQLRDFLGSLRSEAAAGGLSKKFAVEKTRATYSNVQSISGIVQCTPDLSEENCSSCLDEGLKQLQKCCYGMDSGRFVNPSCNLRYNLYFSNDPAINDPPEHYPPPPSANGGRKKSNTFRTVIIIALATVVSLVLFISICIYLRVRNKKKIREENAEEIMKSADALQFNFRSIRAATNNFSEANKLGRGGFGAVYRGILVDDKDVAVKRLSRDSAQGDLEFKTEVSLVARLQHRNLVRLLGFCLEKNERILVYEFVPNASLDQFIFDEVKRTNLDWDLRYKIIVGITRGLLYLHEDSRLKIIHRDLKASNILLDADMNPKIADFGMARLFDLDQSQGET